MKMFVPDKERKVTMILDNLAMMIQPILLIIQIGAFQQSGKNREVQF